MGYVRLSEHSDWGVLYLALPGQGLTASGTAQQKLGIPFRDGQRLHVRWPDNSQTLETVVMHPKRGTVVDTGHTYPIVFTRPGVVQVVRGVGHWTPLADLDVLEEDLVSRESDTASP